ncbi:hypothetical protein [Propionicimonas sp.]|uniref:hypothetical protein n=1 Tax=Propionicimonas sp. TaxID=1955623 RepID=UPI001818D6BD|nr:hypothetical protein [Propionicimonas sp.]MBA3019680.1 hypothetical protein [Propionicimonas sp.]MBU4207975.1 hypothetical protein [Actinomycetota bacterium]MBU4411519.1 hypothetical protein [Actinomycetota bacterium]MCG2805798.1 hypothetical protein [Propionicimonas sp.]
MITTTDTPTDRWLQNLAGTLPPLTGHSGTAERLLLLLHYGIDWDTSWVATHRAAYWDRHLPNKVLVATYMSSSLRSWWTMVAGDLNAAPRNAAERAELANLLEEPSQPVLRILREQTEALILRTRIVAETIRANRPTQRGAS